MSGPKVSSYELEQRRREEEARRAEEERRRLAEEMRRKAEEERRRQIEVIQRLQKQIADIGKKNDFCRSIIAENSTDSRVTEVRDLYMNLCEKCENEQKPFVFSNIKSAKERQNELEKTISELQEGSKRLTEMVDSWKKQVQDQIAAEFQNMDDEEERSVTRKESSREVSVSRTESKKVSDAENKKKKQDAQKLIGELKMESRGSNTIYDAAVKKEINILENLYFLTDYSSVIEHARDTRNKLYKLKQELQREEERIARIKLQKHEAFRAEYVEYLACCEMIGAEAKEFLPEEENEASIEWLRKERIHLEAKYLEQQEKQIIRKELETVMEELGYSVIASKETTRRSGAVVREQVFAYSEGTAINVTEANGMITMEVVGVDTSDRDPVEDESEYLEGEMESFCTSHKEIEKRLAAKGIVLKNRIQMNPPSKAYAKILNITEYNQKREHISMIQGVSEEIKKKKTTAAIAKENRRG